MIVVLTESAYSDILAFIVQYQDFLIRPFFDTGLEGEKQIRERYIDEGDALGREIYKHIGEILSLEIVPYELLENGRKLSVSRFGSRRIFIEYDEKDDVRKVTKLEIFSL